MLGCLSPVAAGRGWQAVGSQLAQAARPTAFARAVLARSLRVTPVPTQVAHSF